MSKLKQLVRRPTYTTPMAIRVSPRPVNECGTCCSLTYNRTSAVDSSSSNWEHFCMWVNRPQRIVSVCLFAPQKYSYLLTYLLTWNDADIWQMSIKSVLTELPTLLQCRWRLSTRLKWSIIRSMVLVSSTVVLLVARIKVMGAQLPVFTRYDADWYTFASVLLLF